MSPGKAVCTWQVCGGVLVASPAVTIGNSQLREREMDALAVPSHTVKSQFVQATDKSSLPVKQR